MADSASTLEAENFERTAEADKIRLLYEKSYPAILISVVNATLLTAAMWNNIDHATLLVWFAAVFISAIVRSVLFLRFRQRAPQGGAVLAWGMPYAATLILAALVWGIGGLWLILSLAVDYQLVIFCFLLGMAGAANIVYAPVRMIALATVVAVLLPATVWFLAYGEPAQRIVAAASVLYMFSAIGSTKMLSSVLHQSFLLGHQLQYAKNRAETIARTDYLTGLNNRGAFYEGVTRQIAYCKRHAYAASLIAIDLDDFKHINDTHGHAAGDQALRHISQLIIKNLRASDICGRVGGEEFMIFLPSTAIDDAVRVAEKMRSAFEQEPLVLADRTLTITASFGVATDSYRLDALLAAADAALYEAKEQGKNRIRQRERVDGVE